MSTDVVIVSVARTPIATAYKGSLVGVDAFDLAEVAMGAAVERSGIALDQFEDMGFGESMQGGGNIGRNVAVRLGLTGMGGVATQRWCASGMAGTQWVAANIAAGMIDVGIGGGTESMSTSPGTSKPGVDGIPGFWMSPGNPETPEAPPFNMALTVGDNTSRLAGVSREDADHWAFTSHQNAVRAIDEGRFEAEIVPVDLPGGGQFLVDEHPRRTSTLEKLASLPVLNPDVAGATTTAANSSGLNDAAAALVLCSREYADAHGLRPLAAIRGWASVGLDPVETGLAPSKALPKALAKSGIGVGDLQSVEVNEAFASVAVAFTRAMGLDPSIVNVNGSGCSLGHPVGCTGARMIVTMVNELIRADQQWGAVAMCAAGGMGSATVIERL
ncbi:thiolase family protein [Aquihabitans sp. G128]|uniref:thiolase family protein n=1 Tax=Aquihabitans sp. G128 TaxID=2849779 RepID=UPI001C21F28E|nr:thiolase family protein [Aquihabitans sp. G128]QXC63346.1 thiolase family protein [Aquihabitans sp. G128]